MAIVSIAQQLKTQFNTIRLNILISRATCLRAELEKLEPSILKRLKQSRCSNISTELNTAIHPNITSKPSKSSSRHCLHSSYQTEHNHQSKED
jgi:hypothetical protein